MFHVAVFFSITKCLPSMLSKDCDVHSRQNSVFSINIKSNINNGYNVNAFVSFVLLCCCYESPSA